jgi:hypothetical protein
MIQPTGLQIERLCMAAAAANGVRWSTVDEATARSYRVAINAVLIYQATEGLTIGRDVALERLEEAARTQRSILSALPEPSPFGEELTKALYRSAATTELVAAVIQCGAAEFTDDAEF